MNNKSDDQEDPANNSPADSPTNEIVGSPGSHSNSSSSRQHRIVELLHQSLYNNDSTSESPNWTLRPEFFNEDVAQDSLSADEDEEEEEEDANEHDSHDDDSEDVDDDDSQLDVGAEDEELQDDNLHHGFDFIARSDDEVSSTDSDYDQERSLNYDTTLPASHHYLGENLEESRGRRVFLDGSVTSLPLFNIRHIVLFPGQVLPISTANMNPRIRMFLKACIEKALTTIGLISRPQVNTIGTTAEIRNYSRQEQDDEDIDIKLIVEGRQRFKLLSAPFETAIEGEIMILPEVSLGAPYRLISSVQRYFIQAQNVPSKFIVSKHPSWVLKKYEAKSVMMRILAQIKDWCNPDSNQNPNNFSYWVSSNLPISDNERMKALSFSCTEARLIWLLDMLEKCEYFGCSNCSNVICNKNQVFPMSRSGPQNSFVNSNGYIHDTITVLDASGLIYEPSWSKEFTWFPGYEWKLAHCGNCSRHIGWCYKRIKPDIRPKRFFGLSRVNVRLQSNGGPTLNEIFY